MFIVATIYQQLGNKTEYNHSLNHRSSLFLHTNLKEKKMQQINGKESKALKKNQLKPQFHHQNEFSKKNKKKHHKKINFSKIRWKKSKYKMLRIAGKVKYKEKV